ncbi:MAG: hypothetical protein AAB388_04070 [Patescibacteria group bacterium]
MIAIYPLLRAGAMFVGALALQSMVERLMKNKLDLKKTLTELGTDLKHLQDRFGFSENSFTVAAWKLAHGEFVDLPNLIKLIKEIKAAYATLPSQAQKTVANVFNLDDYLNNVLRETADSEGVRILGEKVFDGRTIEDHLRRQYLGLFLIGRAGSVLEPDERTAVTNNLLVFHRQIGREADKQLISWYTDPGSDKPPALAGRLAGCPEVEALGVDQKFIAYALGQPVVVSFENLLQDLEKLKF